MLFSSDADTYGVSAILIWLHTCGAASHAGWWHVLTHDAAICQHQKLLDAGWALCGHETPAGQAQGDAKEDMQCKSQTQAAPHRPASPDTPDTTCTEGTPADTRPAADSCFSSTADSAEPCPTFVQLSRDERIVLGQKCKQLIDAGRKDWLLRQGFQARALVLPIFDAYQGM